MIMSTSPMCAQCPLCGSGNVGTKLTLMTSVAWISRLVGVYAVRIYDKKCEACGHEFQVFRK
jgi:predicted nucleic-acid-binding Zn-ribbon protein